MLPYMSCIMFLVIANKNLFLFSECGGSVVFYPTASPACRHQVEAEDLGKLVQVHRREPAKATGAP